MWKVVDGFSNYEVSTLGRVRKGSIILKQHIVSASGCCAVNMRTTDERLTAKGVARLVLTTFVGPGKHVYYKDGDYTNCKLSNLEWAPMVKLRHSSKQLDQIHKSMEIYLRYHRGETINDLTKEFGFSRSNVRSIVIRHRPSISEKQGDNLCVRDVAGKNARSLLTDHEVDEIRALYFVEGYSVKDLATMKSVSRHLISNILGGLVYNITPDTPIRFIESYMSKIPLTHLVSVDRINRIRNAYRRGVRINTIMAREHIGGDSTMQRILFTDEVPFPEGDSVRKLIQTHHDQLSCNRIPFTKEELILLRKDIASNQYSLEELMEKWNVIEYESRVF